MAKRRIARLAEGGEDTVTLRPTGATASPSHLGVGQHPVVVVAEGRRSGLGRRRGGIGGVVANGARYVFTNDFNRLAGAGLDFPAVPASGPEPAAAG